ncbi:HU family DNA-binding protein [Bacteroides sp. 519]|uniref:HU family DNA-binding protein n=1 Tax=Bacteroides sp. 519 TaxID=2302937 RepID=UPI0013D6F516|nr:HU family DNA-binding protein [Bacteroides sp. 519]NDV59432.1 DNA-binding protein [Bacteroides sp. 519]
MAYYDLKKKPSLTTKEGEKEVFYPQMVTVGTLPADDVVKIAAQHTGFSQADIQGVLLALFDTTTTWINRGYRVELGEFGYFTGKIKGRLVEKKTDIRAPSIRFNNVNFRPSNNFKKALNGELQRVPSIGFQQSTNYNMEELEQMLMNYLDKNNFISVANYTRLTGRLKWKATKDLTFFVKKGIIVSRGTGNQKHYIKAKEE